jgi:predicted NAD/FAD-dependent oxidoreductase
MKPRIAVIGAGLSGLTLAHALADTAQVHVFEKSRGVGGRMSTRYADPFYFDHGAQFFTARSKAFQAFLNPFIAQGAVAEWKGKVIAFEPGKKPDKSMWFEPHFVGTPNMNSLCKALAEGKAIALNTEVDALSEKQNDGWHLVDKAGNALGCFDWVVSTAPPPQTVKLFGRHLPAHNFLQQVKLEGCYALMIGFNTPWDKQWIAAKIRDNPLQWVAVNSSKPGRNRDVTSLVVHSRNDWAEAHMDDDMAAAQTFLVQQFESVTGIGCGGAEYLSTHRWRYAIASTPHDGTFYYDNALSLASTGDWVKASRIEDAWNAAIALADKLRSECEI